MTSVYISSTFNDLKDYREAVTRALRKSGIQVIAMEDYVASDNRPLERCLADVRNSDLYIGLFAHRYGFIPTENNPQNRSITELEYRQAQEAKKPCLIFLLDENAPWLPKFMDIATGEGESGQKIRELRAELGNERLASFFRSPDDLAVLATAAVARHEAEQRQALAPSLVAPQMEAPQARELHYHLFLTSLEPDAPLAQVISTQLQYRNRTVLNSASAILATTAAELSSLENGLRQCHAAGVVLSAATSARMQEQGPRCLQVLSALRERTGCLIALCRDSEALKQAQNWGATHLIDMQQWQPGMDLPVAVLDELDKILGAQLTKGASRVVGLPFVVIAMQQQEASDLVGNPSQIADQDTNQALRQLLELRNEGSAPVVAPVAEQLSLVSQWVGRYGNRREDWHPFGSNHPTIGNLIREIVDSLNNSRSPRLKGRFIKAQHYSFDPIMDRDNPLHGIYRELVQGGCILIVDELSLLHPGISEALLRFPFFATEQVSVVSVSPLNPYGSNLFHQLESKLSERLSLAHYRFERDYDPKCELSVGDDRRLKRWLYSSLPTVLQDLREPVPDSGKLRIFAQELGREIDHQMASEYYTKGAGL